MANYNTSSAYAFTELEHAAQVSAQTPDVKVVKNRRPIAASILTPGVLAAFAIVITLVSLMIYNHVQLNELTGEISKLSSELETLQTKNVELNAALESTGNVREIAKMAEAMGMQKRDEFQTNRIYLYHDDKIERTENAPSQTPGDTVKLAITSFFAQFKEYLTVS